MGWPAHWTKQIKKIHKLEQQHADEYIKMNMEREQISKAPDLWGDSKQCAYVIGISGETTECNRRKTFLVTTASYL